MVGSFYGSLALRLSWEDLIHFSQVMNRYVGIFLLVRLATFATTGVYDIIWRYVSLRDAVRLMKAVLLSTLLIVSITYFLDVGRLPRTVFIIDALLAFALLSGIRFARRLLFEGSFGKQVSEVGRIALIYGAGVNGRTLATRFNTDYQLGLKLVGFIDDNPQKLGRSIAGVKVVGSRKEIPDIVRTFGVKELIVAITNPTGELLRDVVQICRSLNIHPRIMSGAAPVDDQKRSFSVTREIGLSDLLSRPKRTIPLDDLRALVRQRRVLVTGAGGSIGSELVRQVYALDPSLLLLVDHSELNLYQIDHEVRLSPNDTSLIVPLLVDIKDKNLLAGVFREYQPEIVFHAAAYKHVHLVEGNPFPAILNNVRGTQNLLELSEQSGVDIFVLISTDKAVRPAGIMGATKRVCELLVADAGERSGRRYSAVRFGNVLGSSGSLIPLLQRQIENGEPLTITHKDMTRYFMLIPEAVSLVLRAATLAKPGDITLLKMGEPVKIVEIARSLLALMGKTEEQSPIVFTGLRPGEKIFEELYISGDELQTQDPDILVLPRGDRGGVTDAQIGSIRGEVKAIIERAERADRDAIARLIAMVKSKYLDAKWTEAPSIQKSTDLDQSVPPSGLWQ